MKDQDIGSNMPPCHVSPIEKEQQVGTDVESSNLPDTGKEQQMSIGQEASTSCHEKYQEYYLDLCHVGGVVKIQ